MKIVITAAAKADLVAISSFIRQDNPKRAATFIDELLDRCDALIQMPHAYPLISRYEEWGIRRCVHNNYFKNKELDSLLTLKFQSFKNAKSIA